MSPDPEIWRLRDLYGSRGPKPAARRSGFPDPTGADDPDAVPDAPDPSPDAPRDEPLEGDAVVDAAARHLLAGCLRLAVAGPPGAGKTWRLRALRSRLGSTFACVYLPVPDLSPDEIRAWIAGSHGPLPADAGASLEDVAAAHARQSAGLVLLVDDANVMPPEIAGALDATLVRTGGALRVVLAGLDEDPRFDAVLGCFSEPFERIAIVPSRPADDRFESSASEPPSMIEPAPPTEPDDGGELPQPSLPVASSHTSDPLEHANDRAWLSRRRSSLLVAALMAVLLAVGIGHWSATSRRATQDRVDPESTAAEVRNEPAALPTSESALPPEQPRTGEADGPLAARGGRSEAVSEAIGASPAAASGSLPSVPQDPPPEPAATSEPATPLLSVHVNARPWARVTVDGRELGLTPLGNVPLTEGTHRFRAELPDGLVIERDVHVDADNRQVTFP